MSKGNRVELYRDVAGKPRVRVRAGNNEIRLATEDYSTDQAARKAATWLVGATGWLLKLHRSWGKAAGLLGLAAGLSLAAGCTTWEVAGAAAKPAAELGITALNPILQANGLGWVADRLTAQEKLNQIRNAVPSNASLRVRYYLADTQQTIDPGQIRMDVRLEFTRDVPMPSFANPLPITPLVEAPGTNTPPGTNASPAAPAADPWAVLNLPPNSTVTK